MGKGRSGTLAFKQLAGRITGISLPVFGVSWNPPANERDIVRETFVFLEDRRALYNDFDREIEDEVVQSVLAIRAELTSALKRLPETAEAVSSLKAMRAACREYLDGPRRGHRGHWGPFPFSAELGRLRAIFGVHVAYLAVKYGIDLDGELLNIIPVEFRDATYLEG
ncbi:MAG: hypothetical protein HY525_00235 [Betaproteobacteria bacterium]|nr:hypothetical protein [Betaproteobacteria bacterium]